MVILIAAISVLAVLLFLGLRTKTINIVSVIRPAPVVEPRTKAVFVGDVMLSRLVQRNTLRSGDMDFPFRLSVDYLHTADILFGNLESPISSRGRDQGSIYSFRAPTSSVEGLSFAGFSVMSLANNHIWDWGADALSDTANILQASGIESIGAGMTEAAANRPAIIERRGLRFGFLAYTNLYPKSLEAAGDRPGISHSAREEVIKAVQDLRSQVDVVVVSMHWGDEYEDHSNAYQRDLAHAFVDAGADVVVGHHPHVAQEVERYKDGLIAYSLGNFVFDQFFSKETMSSFALEVSFLGKRIDGFRSVPVAINSKYQPVPDLVY